MSAQQHGRCRVQHVVLGLIFLKYISDAFGAKHAELEVQKARRVPLPKTATNTPLPESSGFHRERPGLFCGPREDTAKGES
jgi:hypothetical protein